MTSPGVHRLTLLRHVKSDQDGSPDHGRVLSTRGRRQAPVVAEHLRVTGRVPQFVLCSTAARTRETWDLVAADLGGSDAEVRYLDALYLADVGDVLDLVRGVPEEIADVLVVGHEPTTSEVASLLAGPGSDRAALAVVGVGVSTASLALLTTDAPWVDLASGVATLSAVLTPGA